MRRAGHLFANWNNIEKILIGNFIYLFLDYDGTLAPIVETPGKAFMPRRTKEALRRLAGLSNCAIAIVSGRALRDISKRVGLKHITYAGNHGLEIKGPKTALKVQVSSRYRKKLEEIKADLKKRLSSFSGVLVEDKGLSLSAHYRLAEKRDIPKIAAEFYSALSLHEVKGDVAVTAGKKVFEVRPAARWNKGKAVVWLLDRISSARPNRRMKVMPIYIGDDATDEDAFKAIKGRGITVFVGKPGKTKARFYLKGVADVDRFLRAVFNTLKSNIS